MTPGKLLIAQRLIESAHELRAIVALMAEYKNDPAWASAAEYLTNSAETAQ